MEILQELIDAILDPAARHAIAVHVPVALGMLTPPVLLAALLPTPLAVPLRRTALLMLCLLTVSAAVAAQAGFGALERVGDIGLAGRERLEAHQALARWIWAMALCAALLLVLAETLRSARARVAERLAGGLTLLLGGWVGLAAHHGGTATYSHGAGVKQAGGHGSEAPADARVARFRAEVLPILRERCMSCHGPERFATSGLDLTSVAGALRGGTRGAAVVPGDPAASVLPRAVRGMGMPQMPFQGAALSALEIEALERWILDGAVWQ